MWEIQLQDEGLCIPEMMLTEKYLRAAAKYLEFPTTLNTTMSNSIYLTAPSEKVSQLE